MTHFDHTKTWTRVPSGGYAIPNPGLIELTPAGISPLVEAEDREQRRWSQTRAVRMICTVITIICTVFAVVLAVNVILVLGEANPINGFASFVRGFAATVSLGFDNLFTSANAKPRSCSTTASPRWRNCDAGTPIPPCRSDRAMWRCSTPCASGPVTTVASWSKSQVSPTAWPADTSEGPRVWASR